MNELNRRTLITGLISLVAAPAIVRATSIMPVRAYYADGGWMRPKPNFRCIYVCVQAGVSVHNGDVNFSHLWQHVGSSWGDWPQPSDPLARQWEPGTQYDLDDLVLLR